MTSPQPIPPAFLEDTPHRQVLYERVAARIVKHGDEGCWEWQGSRSRLGYAKISRRLDGKPRHLWVHRLTYAWEYGDQPLPLDHLCANPPCVNPKHLQAVTVRVNTLRGQSPMAKNAQRTHCTNGHPFYGDNLYVEPSGRRRCRACMGQRHRDWYEKQPRKTPARKGDRRTHCKYGHPATPENTLYRKNLRAECRVCHRERERERQRRLRE